MVNQLRAISGIQNQGLLRQPVFVLFRAFMGTVSLASPGSSPSFDGAAAAASFLIFALECFFPVAGACGFSNTILPSPGFGTGPCTRGVSIFHALFGFLTRYRVTARYSRYSGKALTHTFATADDDGMVNAAESMEDLSDNERHQVQSASCEDCGLVSLGGGVFSTKLHWEHGNLMLA